MAYKYDRDLEFLKQLESSDLLDLFEVLVFGKDGEKRHNEKLTSSIEYKRHGDDYAKYAERIAEELQYYGSNSFASFIKGEGVLYKEILCDVCDKLKVNYNKKTETTLIEQNMLAKILERSLEEMDDEEVKEMCDELSIKNTDNLNRQALSAATLTLFKMGGFKSYQLAVIVANAVAKTILGRGLSLAGNQVLTRTLSFLTGPVGWIITGVWTAIDIAGPAYRVTIPACIVVATLRLKTQQASGDKKSLQIESI
ncbi:DUF3944 domain-containing protein [Helicobacter pylori]|nr:DUF3944 domain-containing protein [Helicobacter pylori]